MRRNIQSLKLPGAKVYYRDSIGGRYTYVEGKVIDSLPVADAERKWHQKWSHRYGTILKITPVENVDDPRVKYRHLSSVIPPNQFKRRAAA